MNSDLANLSPNPTHSPGRKPDLIKLDQFLKLIGIVATGGAAKHLIQGQQVRVNGEIETRRGRKLQEGDRITIAGQIFAVNLTDQTLPPLPSLQFPDQSPGES